MSDGSSVWTFKKGNRKVVAIVCRANDHWYIWPAPVSLMVLLVDAIPMATVKGVNKPLHRWDGPEGIKTRCADCLDKKAVAVIETLIAKCSAEFEASPKGEHGEVEYKLSGIPE